MLRSLASRSLIRGLAILLLCASAFGAQDSDPAELLVELVDSPDRAAREKFAKKNASKHEIEVWLKAMRNFGKFTLREPGVQSFKPRLRVGGRGIDTEIFVYVPLSYSVDTPAPLMVAAHGTGGSGRRQHEEWKATAEELGMLVLSPTATGANGGYTFDAPERDSTLAAIRWTRRNFNVDENRIFLSGMSRGGHLTWDLALRNPDQFAALAPMIGGPRLSNARGENNLRYMENVAHLPIRDLQGSKDDAHMLSNLHQAFERLKGFEAANAELIEFPSLGHSYRFNAVDWYAFLSSAKRAAVPERVVRAVSSLGEARASWLEITKLNEKKVKEKFVLKVSAQRWNKLSDDKKRAKLVAETDKRTGRIEFRMKGVGTFEGTAKDVTGFRILLSQEMYDPKKPVSVRFNRRVKKHRPKVSAELLLTEFGERFDRTFLPVATVEQ